MRISRMNQIEKYISDHNTAAITDLSKHFQVSVTTIRRDLKALKAAGKIDTVYGGAKIHNDAEDKQEVLKAYAERNVTNSFEKKRIAKKAAELVQENDIIFIDTGTSTVPLVHCLSSFQHLTIVTNSIFVLYACINYPHITAIGLPGVLKNKAASLVGSQTEHMIGTYNIDKAFMACSAFSLDNGASNSSPEELSIKRKVLEQSKAHYLLLDHTKLDRTSLMTFARPDEFHCIITDQKPGHSYEEYFRRHQIQLLIAE